MENRRNGRDEVMNPRKYTEEKYKKSYNVRLVSIATKCKKGLSGRSDTDEQSH